MLFLLWLHLFILSGVISPLLSVAFWVPTDLGSSSFSVLSFCLFILFMGFSRQKYWSGLHSLPQWNTFCQNTPPWPVPLGWSYTAWLMVSLSQTRLWSMWSAWLVWCDCGFCSSALWWRRIRGYGSFLMGETEWRGNWVLFWWVGPCSVNFNSIFCWWAGLFSLSSVQLSCSVLSNSLKHHESQHTNLPIHHQLPEFT